MITHIATIECCRVSPLLHIGTYKPKKLDTPILQYEFYVALDMVNLYQNGEHIAQANRNDLVQLIRSHYGKTGLRRDWLK